MSPAQHKARKITRVLSGNNATTSERRLKGLRVLCVDDNNIVLSTLKRFVVGT